MRRPAGWMACAAMAMLAGCGEEDRQAEPTAARDIVARFGAGTEPDASELTRKLDALL